MIALAPSIAGSRSWTATYVAAGDFAGSGDTMSRTVAPAMTSTVITADQILVMKDGLIVQIGGLADWRGLPADLVVGVSLGSNAM